MDPTKYTLRQGDMSISEYFLSRPDSVLCRKENGDFFKHEELYGIAERINPKRAFLFVSRLLARHIPVEVDDPNVKEAYKAMAKELSIKLKDFDAKNILLLSMAETATQMAPKIAEYLPECTAFDLSDPNTNVTLINSTREPNDSRIACTFNEGHSHQSLHYIQHLENKESLDTLVLIDDEYSTGKTLLSAIYSLWKVGVRPRNIITMSFLDWREDSEDITHFLSMSNPSDNWNYCSIALGCGEFEFSERKLSLSELAAIDKNDNDEVNDKPTFYGRIVYPSDSLSFKKHQPLETVFRYQKTIENKEHIYADNHTKWDELQSEASSSNKPLKYLVVAMGENHFLSDKIAQNLKGLMKNELSEVYLSSITRSPILCSAIIRNENFFTRLLKGHTDTHFKDPLSDSVIERKLVLPNFNNQVNRYLYNVNADDYDKVIFIIEDKLEEINSEELKKLAKKHKNIVILDNCRIN